jgi:hypothetical protein
MRSTVVVARVLMRSSLDAARKRSVKAKDCASKD